MVTGDKNMDENTIIWKNIVVSICSHNGLIQ